MSGVENVVYFPPLFPSLDFIALFCVRFHARFPRFANLQHSVSLFCWRHVTRYFLSGSFIVGGLVVAVAPVNVYVSQSAFIHSNEVNLSTSYRYIMYDISRNIKYQLLCYLINRMYFTRSLIFVISILQLNIYCIYFIYVKYVILYGCFNLWNFRISLSVVVNN